MRVIFGAQNVEVANPPGCPAAFKCQSGAAVQPHRDYRLRPVCGGADLAAAEQTRLGLNVRAVTQNHNMAACCGVPTGQRGHARLRPGLGHRRPRRRGPEPDRQRRPGPGPELHHRFAPVVVLGGVGQLAGSVMAAFGLGIANKIPRTADRCRTGQDPYPRADHSVYSETPARSLRTERTGDRLMNQSNDAHAPRKLGPQGFDGHRPAGAGRAVAMPLLHLLPADNACTSRPTP